MAIGDRSALLGALEQLRLRLLDLSGRNRLLNFRHTAGRALQFSEGQPSAVYQRLVEGANRPSIAILGLPEPPREGWIERNGRLSRPDPVQWAQGQGIPTNYDLPDAGKHSSGANVRALLYVDQLAQHCRKIEREAVSAIEETGANMLFLVLGFLDFPDQPNSDRIFSAPLISVPVAVLRRESAGSQVFFLQYTGDDISENLSLREKLKADHSMILPPLDEEQIDVEEYFSTIQKVVAPRPGFAVRRRVSLCLLNFANMLLVRDLDPENWPQDGKRHCLLDHPVVREIFEGSPRETDGGFGGAPEHKVEDDPGAKIPLVFDADSSQHSALVDVLVDRRNVVIEGPPGTGKSQTITNLIAASLEAGKTVLFVAEKLAALEVVKVRLALAKLDPFVLELHSNKTTKKKVLEELAARKSFDGKPPPNFAHKLQQLDTYRSELRMYRDIINSVTHNALGLSLHEIMWRAERRRCALSVEDRLLNLISISDATEISVIELTRRTDCLEHFGAQYQSLGGVDGDSTFWGFFPDALGPGEDIRLEQLFFSSCEWADRFVDDVVQYAEALDSGVVGVTLDSAEAQLRGLRAVLIAADQEQSLHLVPKLFQADNTGARAKRVLEAFSDQLGRYHALAPIVNQGFRSELSANQERLNVLRQLDGVAARLGASHQSIADLIELCRVLRRESERLADAFRIVGDFCAQKRIPFDGDRSKLPRLARLAQAVTEVPDELLHLQTSGLTREGCVPALEALANVQRQWTRLLDDLNNSLYADALPTEGALRQAILVLQQGEAWYRIFQNRWRSAVSVHKTLQRKKERLRVAHRIEQLERAIEFLHLAERRKNDPAWNCTLGFRRRQTSCRLMVI